jgi:hypothetical protein
VTLVTVTVLVTVTGFSGHGHGSRLQNSKNRDQSNRDQLIKVSLRDQKMQNFRLKGQEKFENLKGQEKFNIFDQCC